MDPSSTPVDPVLARVAGRLLATHRPDPDRPDRCAHPRCRRPYPCGFARVATEASEQAGAGAVPAGREAAGVG